MSTTKGNLNLNGITPDAYDRLLAADVELIGSADYIGLAWFWNPEYRHALRDATPYRRRLVHKRLRAAGLNVSGKSRAHGAIIDGVIEWR